MIYIAIGLVLIILLGIFFKVKKKDRNEVPDDKYPLF